MARARTKEAPSETEAPANGENLNVPAVAPLCTRWKAPPAFLDLGYSTEQWQLMTLQQYPDQEDLLQILNVARLCKARDFDIATKPYHIVEMWSSKKKRNVPAIWPSTTLYEIIAHRTGVFAGKEPTRFGPVLTFKDKNNGNAVDAPEWADVTLYRLVGSIRCPFTERIYFKEVVKRQFTSGALFDQWAIRPNHMLGKCALSACLRLTFPESVGSEPTAEEMDGGIMMEAETTPLMAAADVPKAASVIVNVAPPAEQLPDAPPEQKAEETPEEKKEQAASEHGNADETSAVEGAKPRVRKQAAEGDSAPPVDMPPPAARVRKTAVDTNPTMPPDASPDAPGEKITTADEVASADETPGEDLGAMWE